MAASEFEAATAVRPAGDHCWSATLSDRWNGIAGLVNGGYLVATATRALGQDLPFPDPVAVSAFFLRPGTPGPATIATSVIRAGKTMAFGSASLVSGGKETVTVTAAFGDLGEQTGPAFTGAEPPELPPPDDCVPLIAPPTVTIGERIDYRAAELPGWAIGTPSGNPSLDLWLRFADGGAADVYALPLLVDAVAPVALEVGVLSTTVELTVHVRARPAPGWLACRAVTRFVAGSYHEEDFEIWDSAGTLVAQSRQLAQIIR